MFWRPVVAGIFSYTEADAVAPIELYKANAALDIKIEMEEAEIERQKNNR
jgi:hypothetical protein